MKDAKLSLLLTEVMNIARLTSPLPDMLRLSSPRPRLRHGRRLALFFCPNLTLNLYSLLCYVAGSPSSSPNIPNCSSPRKSALIYATYLRSHFLSLSQRPSTSEPEATFVSSAELRAQRSLTCPFAHPSTPLNFLQLPPTSLRPVHCHWPR